MMLDASGLVSYYRLAPIWGGANMTRSASMSCRRDFLRAAVLSPLAARLLAEPCKSNQPCIDEEKLKIHMKVWGDFIRQHKGKDGKVKTHAAAIDPTDAVTHLLQFRDESDSSGLSAWI